VCAPRACVRAYVRACVCVRIFVRAYCAKPSFPWQSARPPFNYTGYRQEIWLDCVYAHPCPTGVSYPFSGRNRTRRWRYSPEAITISTVDRRFAFVSRFIVLQCVGRSSFVSFSFDCRNQPVGLRVVFDERTRPDVSAVFPCKHYCKLVLRAGIHQRRQIDKFHIILLLHVTGTKINTTNYKTFYFFKA
jgi:hypothetical protein